ncbi:kinase-like domain-containing protein [Trichoderma austrokoningii]
MLPRHLNGQRTYPVLDSVPNSPNESSAASNQPPSGGTDGLLSSDILNLHRKGSKVWSEIRGKLMARVGKNSYGSQNSGAPDWYPSDAFRSLNIGKTNAAAATSSNDASSPRKAKGAKVFPAASGFMQKLRHNNQRVSPLDGITAGGSSSQQRDLIPSLPSVTESDDSSSERDGVWSSTHSSRLTGVGDTSTNKTSLDSRVSSSPSAKGGSPRRKLSRRSRWTRSSPEAAGLGTIAELTADKPKPTILTVEKAAAAKIYLETYFNELCSEAYRRSLRRQQFHQELFRSAYVMPGSNSLTYSTFYYRESCRLRDIRSIKSKCTIQAKQQNSSTCASKYEFLKILGKGSFGVVKLVREKSDSSYSYPSRVFAMKVIRKSDMLRSSQEGHLRAERDFLVSYEGSNWVVPLIASFDDLSNLYLVMEYMPGGDFLGLLIRENILHEAVACFYIAEMILAVEEAHRLGFIHRDIKPDNFLISSSGHLKISDFGLAFDGQWPHDASYYNYHRYSLLRKLNIDAKGDEKDQEDNKGVQGRPEKARGLAGDLERHDEQSLGSDQDLTTLLEWRHRCGNRTRANSVVGTSQYMAPESIGIILFECLYGHTPFLSDEGRKPTKQNILAHKEKFRFPARPFVTDKCKDLIYSLIQDKEVRLCSKRYQTLDQRQPGTGVPTDRYGRYVFPNDAEDIKAHRFFKPIPWDTIQNVSPPFIPHINSLEDSHYFDESEPLDDWIDSATERPGLTDEEVRWILRGYGMAVQNVAIRLINAPYDSGALRSRDLEIDSMSAFDDEEKELLKRFTREYGRRVPKRPRDIILRDEKMKDTAMIVRKQSAFMGYAWHSVRRTY